MDYQKQAEDFCKKVGLTITNVELDTLIKGGLK